MRAIALLLITLILLPLSLRAQLGAMSQKVEFGLWGGTAHYFGDLAPSLDNYYQLFQPAFGVFNRININPRIAVKTSINAGRIRGNDAWSPNVFQQSRNLSFRSLIIEAGTQLEFNFFKYILDSRSNRFTPYVFIGIAGFYHNPQAELNGEWYDLQPLGTEVQQFPDYSGRDPYSLFQVAIPYGGGFKFNVSKGFNVALEIGYRGTYTDYLDDVSTTYIDNGVIEAGQNGGVAAALADRSGEVVDEPIGIEGTQRGNSQNVDAYIFTGIQISYTFRSLRCPQPGFSF